MRKINSILRNLRRGAALSLFMVCWVMVASHTLFAQTDSTFWYINGQPHYWYYQIDMFAFRCVNGADYTGYLDTSVVSLKIHQANRRDRAIELYFKATATPQEKLQQLQEVYASGQLEAIYPVINQNPLQLSIGEQWYLVDDLVLVLFEDNADSLDIVDFMNKYQLTLHHAPPASLPVSGNYTYVFKLPPFSKTDFIEIIQTIYENESGSGFVLEAAPNLVNYARAKYDNSTQSYPPDPPSSTGGGGTSINCNNLNDPISPSAAPPENYRAWALDNLGFTTSVITGANVTAVSDADADICECWDLGYTGQDIRMAIMGDGFFISTHPDMQGTNIINALDCQTGNCFTYNHTIIPTPAPYTQGLVKLAGIVGAQPNNNTGTIGIAPNTEILTLMTADYRGNSSSAAIVASLQAMGDDWNIDVSITNIVSHLDDAIIHSEITHLIDNGRKNPYPQTSGVYSMAFVASPGNEYVLNQGYFPPLLRLATLRHIPK